MKKILNSIMIVIAIVMLTTFIVHTSVEGQTTSYIPTQAIIHNQPPVFFLLSRTDEKSPKYNFSGTLVICDSLFNIQALTVYSPSDSTQLRTNFVHRSMEFAQGCHIEMFKFNVHGGALRRQLEKAGRCTIMIHGINRVMLFEMTAQGETLLLNIIVKPKRSI